MEQPLSLSSRLLLFNQIVDRALAYEVAWGRYANPGTSPDLTEEQRIIAKAHAHQDLLDAVRAYRREPPLHDEALTHPHMGV